MQRHRRPRRPGDHAVGTVVGNTGFAPPLVPDPGIGRNVKGNDYLREHRVRRRQNDGTYVTNANTTGAT